MALGMNESVEADMGERMKKEQEILSVTDAHAVPSAVARHHSGYVFILAKQIHLSSTFYPPQEKKPPLPILV